MITTGEPSSPPGSEPVAVAAIVVDVVAGREVEAVVAGTAEVVGEVELAGTTNDGAGRCSVSPLEDGTWIQAISSPFGQSWMAFR